MPPTLTVIPAGVVALFCRAIATAPESEPIVKALPATDWSKTRLVLAAGVSVVFWSARAFASESVPAVSAVGPVKVLAAARTSVPVPRLERPTALAPVFVSASEAASVNVPAAALVVSRPRVEPLRKPPVAVPRPAIMPMSAEVNSPVPPTSKTAVAPEATARLAAVQLVVTLL